MFEIYKPIVHQRNSLYNSKNLNIVSCSKNKDTHFRVIERTLMNIIIKNLRYFYFCLRVGATE